MLERDHQRIIDELQRLIGDTQTTLSRADAHGLNDTLPNDAHLLDIMDRAIKKQLAHTRVMLTRSLKDHSIRSILPQPGRQGE